MFGLGASEVFIIGFIIFLLFGPKAFIDISREVGKIIRKVRQGASQLTAEADLPSDITDIVSKVDRKASSETWDDSNDFKVEDKAQDWRPKTDQTKEGS